LSFKMVFIQSSKIRLISYDISIDKGLKPVIE